MTWLISSLLLAQKFGAFIPGTVSGAGRQARRKPGGKWLPSVYTQEHQSILERGVPLPLLNRFILHASLPVELRGYLGGGVLVGELRTTGAQLKQTTWESRLRGLLVSECIPSSIQ